MKPTSMQPGQALKVRDRFGAGERDAVFVKRMPRACGRPAFSVLRFPDFAGQHGADDEGLCPMSDYDVARRVSAAT